MRKAKRDQAASPAGSSDVRFARYRLGVWVASSIAVSACAFLLYLSMQPGGLIQAEEARLPEGTPVVARVAGTPITLDRLVADMERLDRAAPGSMASPAARRALLDELIRFESLAAGARAAGYTEDPQLLHEWKRLLVRRYESAELEPRIADLEVGDEEVARFFDAHQERYTRPERRRLAMIFVEAPTHASADHLAERRDRIEEARAVALAEPSEAGDFGPIARRLSDDRATRYRGGDVGWISSGQDSYRWEPAVVESMFALSSPGDLSSVIRGERGFYLVKLLEREEARAHPMARVAPTIRRSLLDAKRKEIVAAFHEDLAGETDVEIDSNVLESALLLNRGATIAVAPPPLPSE